MNNGEETKNCNYVIHRKSHYLLMGQFVNSYFRILKMIFNIWIFQLDSYFKQRYVGATPNLFLVSCGPLWGLGLNKTKSKSMLNMTYILCYLDLDEDLMEYE